MVKWHGWENKQKYSHPLFDDIPLTHTHTHTHWRTNVNGTQFNIRWTDPFNYSLAKCVVFDSRVNFIWNGTENGSFLNWFELLMAFFNSFVTISEFETFYIKILLSLFTVIFTLYVSPILWILSIRFGTINMEYHIAWMRNECWVNYFSKIFHNKPDLKQNKNLIRIYCY